MTAEAECIKIYMRSVYKKSLRRKSDVDDLVKRIYLYRYFTNGSVDMFYKSNIIDMATANLGIVLDDVRGMSYDEYKQYVVNTRLESFEKEYNGSRILL